jgi:transcriptional/translational regulatory protein YebC/TACO1
VELGDADKQQVSGFLNDIDDHDDVHRLYVAMK